MIRTKKVFTIENNQKRLRQLIVSEFDAQNQEIIRLIYNGQKDLRLIIKKEYAQWNKILTSATFQGNGKRISRVHYQYDPLHRLIEKQFYNNQEQVIARNLWTYENDLLKQYEKRGKANHLIERKVFEYRDGGLLEKESHFNGHNQLVRQKIFIYNAVGQLTTEKIFNAAHQLVAQKEIRYGLQDLPEVILWFDKAWKLQRTEYFEYYENGLLKAEIVNDLFGGQFFSKKLNRNGQILTSYHLQANQFEKIELYYYDQKGRKTRQEKYAIQSAEKRLVQQINYEYEEKKIDFLQQNNFYC